MTSRSHFGSPVQELQLNVLSEEKALELLRVLVQDQRVDREIERSQELCAWLGYLPLGVELVGRYLAKKKDVSIELLWQRLQEKRLEAKAFKQAEPGMTATLGVAAAFELSWQTLEESAQQVAAVLSLFALVEIPWTMVEQCLPETDAEDLEDIRDQVLLSANLLKRVDQGMYQLHQLVKEFFAVKREQREDGSELKQKFYEVVIAEAERVRDKPERSLIKESTVTIAHLKETHKVLEVPLQGRSLGNCLFWTAELYKMQGSFGEAEFLYQQALELRQKFLGENHCHVAQTLYSLAEIYYWQERYVEAELLHEDVLKLRQHLLGDNHLDVAQSLNELGHLYCRQERYAEAEPLLRQALLIRQHLVGDNHPDTAQSLNDLAIFHVLLNRYTEAEFCFQQALTIRQNLFGSIHFLTGFSLGNLASFYTEQTRYKEAELLFLQALSISLEQLGKNHPWAQSWYENFRSLLQKAIQENRTDELSDDPMTRSILQELQDALD
jgi:tetratricopeptide (TPR) repeat protein